MANPRLYLMLGYPGAGKTTVAQLIADHTGATHLWADLERHKLFDKPSHGKAENQQLYERLNQETGELLAKGKSVVFDTNFNYRRDRDLLRGIAGRRGAEAIVVWLVTTPEVARDRAVHANVVRNGYDFVMTPEQFDTIASHLEPPGKDEKVIKINGVKLDPNGVLRLI